MARLVFHEHPRQKGNCLQGAFADYVKRIPVRDYRDLDAIWQDIRRRPFELDRGGIWGPELVSSCPAPADRVSAPDARCSPAQRSRIWPTGMNCWEATAHFCAGALRFLHDSWAVHVWDRDLPSEARHLWPSLMTPKGDHLLVDLNSIAPREYPGATYSGRFQGVPTDRTTKPARVG